MDVPAAHAPTDRWPAADRSGAGSSSLLETRLLGIRVVRAISYLAWFWVVASLAVLLFGFVLLLVGADPTAAFAEWVYRALDRTMRPFRGIVQTVELRERSVLDLSIVFAMIVYAVAGLAVRVLLDWLAVRLVHLEGQLRTRDEAPTQLRQLGHLHGQGVLSDEEFALAKQRVLRS